MATPLTCPSCGKKCRRPDNLSGEEVRCPSCLISFPVGATPAPYVPTMVEQAPAPAVNRTVMAEAALIRYNCPRCKKSLELPASLAGSKLSCPDCRQRLQLPQPSTRTPPLDKTILATEEVTIRHLPSASPALPPHPVPLARIETASESRTHSSSPSAQRETCLECGRDISQHARVQTCPDCSAVFCSAACSRDHQHYAHARQRRRRRDEECRRCGSTARPFVRTVISDSGWIVFAILLVFFFPLCWIGLLITESRETCADCGARLR